MPLLDHMLGPYFYSPISAWSVISAAALRLPGTHSSLCRLGIQDCFKKSVFICMLIVLSVCLSARWLASMFNAYVCVCVLITLSVRMWTLVCAGVTDGAHLFCRDNRHFIWLVGCLGWPRSGLEGSSSVLCGGGAHGLWIMLIVIHELECEVDSAGHVEGLWSSSHLMQLLMELSLMFCSSMPLCPERMKFEAVKWTDLCTLHHIICLAIDHVYILEISSFKHFLKTNMSIV